MYILSKETGVRNALQGLHGSFFKRCRFFPWSEQPAAFFFL
jgi:hypothetical protein